MLFKIGLPKDLLCWAGFARWRVTHNRVSELRPGSSAVLRPTRVTNVTSPNQWPLQSTVTVTWPCLTLNAQNLHVSEPVRLRNTWRKTYEHCLVTVTWPNRRWRLCSVAATPM